MLACIILSNYDFLCSFYFLFYLFSCIHANSIRYASTVRSVCLFSIVHHYLFLFRYPPTSEQQSRHLHIFHLRLASLHSSICLHTLSYITHYRHTHTDTNLYPVILNFTTSYTRFIRAITHPTSITSGLEALCQLSYYNILFK